MDFLKLLLVLAPEVDAMVDTGCTAIAPYISHVGECEDLEVESAVVDLAGDRGEKTRNGDSSIHNIVMMLALQWLDGKIHSTQRAIEVLEKLADLFDPETH
jgi:hypothetical protein